MIGDGFRDAWALRPQIQLAILAFSTVYAFARGSAPEKAVAATFVTMILGDHGYDHLFPTSAGLSWAFLLDAIATIAFVGIGLFANRTYTLWIGSFQIIALSAHLIRVLTIGEVLTLPFAILYILPSYFQIGLFLCGTHQHAQRVNQFGPYRSWKSF